MTRDFPEYGEKPLHWMGSTKKDLSALPSEVATHFGMALGAAQNGRKHPDAKPWKGDGPGVTKLWKTTRAYLSSHLYRSFREGSLRIAHLPKEVETWDQDAAVGSRPCCTTVRYGKSTLRG